MMINNRPVTYQNNTSFGALKFQLDKSSKELFYNICKKENLTNSEIVKNISELNESLDSFTKEANNIAQTCLENCDKMKGTKLAEVWPDETLVNVSLRREVSGNDEEFLIGFNEKNYIKESSCDPYGVGYGSRNDRKITAKDFINIFSKLTYDQISYFVENQLKKQPQYKKLLSQTSVKNVETADNLEKSLLSKITDWLNN